MADYIIKGETLTGIANAIRRKTGGTEPINPTDMPGQIDGISGGGGGGSLPAGAYWQAPEAPPPLNYPNCHFVYNGELYLWAATAASTSSTRIYKLENGKWTQVLAFESSLPQIAINPIEYNGKIHGFATSGTYHYVYDGQAVTALSRIPSASVGATAFVYNGALYIAKELSTIIFKWDELTDTWAETNDITAIPSQVTGAFSYGGNAYLLCGQNICKVIDGVASTVGSISVTNPTGAEVVGNCLYYCYYNSAKFYKFNLETNEDSYVGAVIPHKNTSHLYAYNGAVHIAGGADMYRIDLALHEVTE